MTTENPNIRLEALGGMTQATEADNPSAEDQQQAAAEQTKASEAEVSARAWAMVYFTIGNFCQMIAPELKPIYSEERCLLAGQQTHLVGKKYGWNGPSSMPEIALFATMLGFAVPSYFAITARVKEAKEGQGPSTWVAKAGLWWRTRKARAAAAGAVPQPVGPKDGA